MIAYGHMSASERVTERQLHLQRLGALKNEQASFRDHWRELNEYILPRGARFLNSDRNKGTKRHQKIINSTATKAAGTLAAGMQAGITSPARPWFRLTTPDRELAEFFRVQEWLHKVTRAILTAFARSNVYKSLHGIYLSLGVYGTAASIVEGDVEDGLRAYDLPIGQYYLANSARMAVDTLYRELSLTTAQCLQMFGEQACSPRILEAYRTGRLDQWFEVAHCIYPNEAYQHGRMGSEGMRWRSDWLELAGDERQGFLRRGGYHEFPVLAPRWDVTGEDVYATSCPGMTALGDVKALQSYERKAAQAVAKLVDPPMKGPPSLATRRASLLPGDLTHVEPGPGGQSYEPAHIVDARGIVASTEKIREHERRINADFYADLWLSMLQADRGQITAREVIERHEEKMLQLGPVTDRLQDELLDPLIDRTFGELLRAGQLPEPPEELEGQDLRVEHISIMAQAQKALNITSIERLTGFVGSLAAARPDALDKLNVDKIVDAYADAVGTAPDLIASQDQVDEIRAERAKLEQQKKIAEYGQAAAQGAKTLSEADLETDNGLSRLLATMGATGTVVGGEA